MLCFAGIASAQKTQTRHEFGFSAGFGRSALNYAVNTSTNAKLFDPNRSVHIIGGWGGEGAVGYTFLFNPRWGVGIGAGIGYYNTLAVLSGNTIVTKEQEEENYQSSTFYTYDLHTKFDFYEETQKLWTLNVPVFVQHETEGWHRVYFRLGGKLSLPVMNPTYEITDALFNQNVDYYDLDNVEKYEDKLTTKGDLSLQIGVMLSAEMGAKWRLGSTASLYTGVYFDYGVLDMNNGGKKPFVQATFDATETPTFAYNSILHSKIGEDGDNLFGRVSPIAVGVVVRLAIGTPQGAPDPAPLADVEDDWQPSRRASAYYGSVPQRSGSRRKPPPREDAYYVTAPQPQSAPPSDAPRQGRRINVPTNAASGDITLVQIYDSSGILIHEHLVKGAVATVEIPYQKGTYLVQVGRQIKKVVVE